MWIDHPDLANGVFEAVGGLFIFKNCYVLYRDKMVRGVSVEVTAFFALWGVWNLYYYPHLGQWLSFAGGVGIVLANSIWAVMAYYYIRNKNGKR